MISLRWPTLAWCLAFAVIFFIYLPSMHGPYILDDSHSIHSNVGIQNLSQIGKIWTSARYYSSTPDNWGYRPVTTTAFALCWWIGSGATWPFHLFKVLMFCGICFLVHRLWTALLPKASPEVLMAGLLLFAVNPVHTQVVSYLAATTSLLAGLFVCATLLVYLKYRNGGARGLLPLMALTTFLAVLSKEEGIVVVGLIPLVELYLRKLEGRALFKKLPWLGFVGGAMGGALGVALIVMMFEPSSDIGRGSISRSIYFMTQWRAYLRYMFMYVAPIFLNADNLEFGFVKGITEPRVLVALAANLALIGLAVWQWRKRPVLLLALLWFYASVSPSSSVIALAEPVNDHRCFIAYMGFGLIGIAALEVLWQWRRPAFAAVVVLVFSVYVVGTFQRNQVWANNELLWRDTVAKNPSSPRALNNLAVDLMAKGRYAETLELLERCHVVGWGYGHCYVNEAISQAALGNDKKAEELFDFADNLDVSRISSRIFRAVFLKSRGQITRAYKYLSEVDQFTHGRNFQVRRDMIDIALQMGNRKLAQELYEESRSELGDLPDLMSIGKTAGFDP